jgi:hypothetical protein
MRLRPDKRHGMGGALSTAAGELDELVSTGRILTLASDFCVLALRVERYIRVSVWDCELHGRIP